MRLLNKYEEVTFGALKEVCTGVEAHVFPKVRIADIFEIKNSGISSTLFSYALKAHFDFVVTNSDYHPLFSVEFDGSLHKINPTQKENDCLKDELCWHFQHGLLRINSLYLRKEYRGLDLLTYFVDAWFLEEAFYEAQNQGIVPYDEPFDVTFIISDGMNGPKKWPYWLSLDVQLAIQELHRKGKVAQMVPSHHVGIDNQGNYRCMSWLVIDKERVIRVVTGMRAQQFSAVCKSELISMLAMFDVYEQLKSTIEGRKSFSIRHEKLNDELKEFKAKYGMVSSLSCGSVTNNT